MSNASRAVVLGFAIAVLLYAAYTVRSVLVLTYVSVVFAIMLCPAVERVHSLRIGRWRPGRGASILIIVLLVALAAFVFFWIAIPPIVRDIQQMAESWPIYVRRVTGWLQELPFGDRLNPEMLQQYTGKIVGGVSGFLGDFVGVITALASALILTAYLILDGGNVFRWATALFPRQARPRLRSTLHRGAARMRRWMVGQGLLMLILGGSSAIVFGLLGVRYYFFLAVFAGVANIIPVVGPVLTVIVAGIVAAVDSFGKLVGVLIFYVAYQQVESAYLTPRIMGARVQLSATAIILALLLGAEIAGVAGAIVAVPTAALASVVIGEYLIDEEEEEDREQPRREAA